MKANFHLITETEEEVLACTKFIESILMKRKERGTMEDGVPTTRLPTVSGVKEWPALRPTDRDDDDVPAWSNETKEVKERANVSPGEPTIVKIGSNTQETIMHKLEAGFGVEEKYEEHAKLLWKRGLIKFDGEEYYVD